ncbi:hypothetical protein [Mucilaginibacter lappiensis]|uniref:Outer membrane protein beta-barrel domain-containing protein n=1 Tax=Mucilaginibacter lappiensis TaxID=354630 RepID=A0A1N6PGV2_9SPHI|nr:hypothetical protein [Mucilaginibacter lappiensis]MBB6107587.1 hypothetical protein [Mucilaginibacter lappiensis]MBB6126093.1 hypothetical protein [Mucilaginibacter lappiensis]SIQ03561.1 hypothetical protein SAMN05421821_101493 [Mucilaginibacter lappiensis]
MKQLFTLICFLMTTVAFAQKPPTAPIVAKALLSKRDSTTESDTSKENKEPRYYYLSVNTNVFVNTKGGFAKRFAPAIEFGRTYGIFDIGLATGYTNTLSGDTSHYLEFRPTINVFSKGRFAEALCLGAGYVLGAKQGLMTEICNSINFNISETIAIAVTQGYVFYDGTNNNRGTQYMGLAFTYNFLKPHSVNKQRKKKAIVSDN